MNKNVMFLTVLFMVFVGFQLAEPAAAVNVVDHGTRYGVDTGDHIKIVWKTYQYNNNFLKVYSKCYYKDPDTKKYILNYNSITTIKKIKNTIKTTEIRGHYVNPVNVHYAKTKLTAAQYYWRVFRNYW
ncbi:hypothetical protein [Methanobacterium sp.]|uniref:hypothetical protein n=1 Tax=Methanobacterium sp. TaxID=2164 RepID=UPI003C718470